MNLRLSHARHPIRRIVHLHATLGVVGTAAYLFRRGARDSVTGEHLIVLRARDVEHPLICRGGTSDLNVFRDVFIRSEYSVLDDSENVRFIVDCGANVGFASAYLLSRFPAAELTAVEPDDGNFRVLARNLRPYGERVTVLHAGIWTDEVPLTMHDEPYRDGLEWTRQVREALPGELATIPGIDIGTLLDRSGHERISLLKIDIEGAEAAIFADDRSHLWLDRVDNLIVELHDDSQFGDATSAFERAIRGLPFACSRREGPSVAICRRVTPTPR